MSSSSGTKTIDIIGKLTFLIKMFYGQQIGYVLCEIKCHEFFYDSLSLYVICKIFPLMPIT